MSRPIEYDKIAYHAENIALGADRVVRGQAVGDLDTTWSRKEITRHLAAVAAELGYVLAPMMPDQPKGDK